MQEDVLSQMVQLIRDRPSIGAEALARAMGYAQSKTVLYWMRKAGFRGIRSFRDAVLRGDFPSPAPIAEATVQESEPSAWPEAGVRACERLGPAGMPVFDPRPFVPRLPLALLQRGFAFRWAQPGCEPVVLPGDVLLVDPGARPADGDLCLVAVAGQAAALRRIYGSLAGARTVWAHPVLGQPTRDEPARLVGRILQVLRDL